VSGTPLAEQNEQVESLPLITKRRILGILVPAMNLPFFAYNLYSIVMLYLSGGPMNTENFYSNLVLTILTLVLLLGLPRWIPVYTSKYTLEAGGLRITRFLKGTIILNYKDIPRVEVYIREPEEIPEDALNYTKDTAEKLRKTGFSFVDYTNSEANIVLLMSGRKIYMISPAKPRAFLKSLKKRAPKLTAKIVELNKDGKKVQELE
jgi:hypothetical protein